MATPLAAALGALLGALALGEQQRPPQTWTLVKNPKAPVLGPGLGHPQGVMGGFEGGEYFRTADGTYHYFATEMVNAGQQDHWAGTRGGHWTALDPSTPETESCDDHPRPCAGHAARTFCPNSHAVRQCIACHVCGLCRSTTAPSSPQGTAANRLGVRGPTRVSSSR